MRRLLPLLTVLSLLSSGALAASAAQPSAPAQDNPRWHDYVTPYIGVFDVTSDDSNETLQLGAEYRFRDVFYGLRPTLGFNVDVEGGAYGYGGFNWDIPLGSSNFLLIPNFMVGAYHEGDSKDLGGALEFRSGLELAYQMQNMHRVGLAFNHISNASIYDKNPGAEAVLLNYSVPSGALFGR